MKSGGGKAHLCSSHNTVYSGILRYSPPSPNVAIYYNADALLGLECHLHRIIDIGIPGVCVGVGGWGGGGGVN